MNISDVKEMIPDFMDVDVEETEPRGEYDPEDVEIAAELMVDSDNSHYGVEIVLTKDTPEDIMREQVLSSLRSIMRMAS